METEMGEGIWLAPLRGVTVRTFRDVFSAAIVDAGFAGMYAPFIPANAGFRFSRRLFADILPPQCSPQLALVPQVIGKDPAALRDWCKAVKDLGYGRADLNAGCPFPMIRRKGRGSGLLRSPEAFERMLETGCDEMGPGNFSVKARLGLERPDELLRLMPMINRYPLAVLTVHARTAVQMYGGEPDRAAFEAVRKAAAVPVMYNGDATVRDANAMVGRSFIRSLANRADALSLLKEYCEASRAELFGDAPVLGRMKELLSYWCQEPAWRRLWPQIKICRTLGELVQVCDGWRVERYR